MIPEVNGTNPQSLGAHYSVGFEKILIYYCLGQYWELIFFADSYKLILKIKLLFFDDLFFMKNLLNKLKWLINFLIFSVLISVIINLGESSKYILTNSDLL